MTIPTGAGSLSHGGAADARYPWPLCGCESNSIGRDGSVCKGNLGITIDIPSVESPGLAPSCCTPSDVPRDASLGGDTALQRPAYYSLSPLNAAGGPTLTSIPTSPVGRQTALFAGQDAVSLKAAATTASTATASLSPPSADGGDKPMRVFSPGSLEASYAGLEGMSLPKRGCMLRRSSTELGATYVTCGASARLADLLAAELPYPTPPTTPLSTSAEEAPATGSVTQTLGIAPAAMVALPGVVARGAAAHAADLDAEGKARGPSCAAGLCVGLGSVPQSLAREDGTADGIGGGSSGSGASPTPRAEEGSRGTVGRGTAAVAAECPRVTAPSWGFADATFSSCRMDPETLDRRLRASEAENRVLREQVRELLLVKQRNAELEAKCVAMEQDCQCLRSAVARLERLQQAAQIAQSTQAAERCQFQADAVEAITLRHVATPGTQGGCMWGPASGRCRGGATGGGSSTAGYPKEVPADAAPERHGHGQAEEVMTAMVAAAMSAPSPQSRCSPTGRSPCKGSPRRGVQSLAASRYSMLKICENLPRNLSGTGGMPPRSAFCAGISASGLQAAGIRSADA
mmetsp:Transcript_25855/g.72096  ORF Transcript_25855/g.72096 Transcript_25855/m.72096 type:complete len:575 (-) Transcript_25855:80-1804(-)